MFAPLLGVGPGSDAVEETFAVTVKARATLVPTAAARSVLEAPLAKLASVQLNEPLPLLLQLQPGLLVVMVAPLENDSETVTPLAAFGPWLEMGISKFTGLPTATGSGVLAWVIGFSSRSAEPAPAITLRIKICVCADNPVGVTLTVTL